MVPQIRPYRKVLHCAAIGKHFLLLLSANSNRDGSQPFVAAIGRRLFRKVIHLRAFLPEQHRTRKWRLKIPSRRQTDYGSVPPIIERLYNALAADFFAVPSRVGQAVG